MLFLVLIIPFVNIPFLCDDQGCKFQTIGGPLTSVTFLKAFGNRSNAVQLNLLLFALVQN